ncbi:Pol Polyprotein [Phytophthora megakarya]|uniref:Pol Polyprotein n=1 Tax=Phytophthora megakarya TaxID=4795 RepID=A0A225UPL6_9STRA|nr:Pol Polyprotein [Phytophthora megakarya]
MKNHEQATPASPKDNVSVRGTDTAKTHAQAGPVAPGPAEITHEVSVTGADTTKSHTQSRTDANTSGGSVQGTDAPKVNELDPGFCGQQKLKADNVGRGNTNEFEIGSLVLLATQTLPTHADSEFGASLLALRFIGPFTVAERHGSAYTLELPSGTRLHPTFDVERLKPNVQPESSSCDDSPTTPRGATSGFCQTSSSSPEEGELVPTSQHGCLRWSEYLSDLSSLNVLMSLHTSVGRLQTVVNQGLTI